MTKVGVDRPEQVALLNAITDAIEEIAPGKMTTIEVLGVLEQVKLQTYTEYVLAPVYFEG